MRFWVVTSWSPVTSRALLFGRELGFEGCDACLERGDDVGDRPVTSR
jgi:hypothetical protein